jgi:hypothetical protein
LTIKQIREKRKKRAEINKARKNINILNEHKAESKKRRLEK